MKPFDIKKLTEINNVSFRNLDQADKTYITYFFNDNETIKKIQNYFTNYSEAYNTKTNILMRIRKTSHKTTRDDYVLSTFLNTDYYASVENFDIMIRNLLRTLFELQREFDNIIDFLSVEGDIVVSLKNQQDQATLTISTNEMNLTKNFFNNVIFNTFVVMFKLKDKAINNNIDFEKLDQQVINAIIKNKTVTDYNDFLDKNANSFQNIDYKKLKITLENPQENYNKETCQKFFDQILEITHLWKNLILKTTDTEAKSYKFTLKDNSKDNHYYNYQFNLGEF